MAQFAINNVAVKGISGAVPKEVYNNLSYKWISEKEREMFIKTTGVAQRHVARFGLTTSDLCEAATNKLLQELQWDKSEIDILIFVSQSRDYLIPATACILQNKMNLSKACLAFDVNMGCSGYTYGLSIISALLENGNLKKGLLLVGDVSTLNTSYNDKSTFPLFGDAGTCTAIEHTPKEKIFFNLQTDGEGHEAIIIRDGGSRNYASEKSFERKKIDEGIERNKVQLELDGMEVFNFSLREVALNVTQLLSHSEIQSESIDYFVFHQANKLINESIRKKLKLLPEKVPYSLHKYGNTSSASIPITILSELEEITSERSTTLLLSGFGVGLSWGSVILTLNNIVCLPIIEVD
jgi:3-oxoacyl-[acyl-carrier-protein] synthase-3